MNTERPISQPRLDQAIDILLAKMIETGCETKEYATMAEQLTKLYQAREIEFNAYLKNIEIRVKEAEMLSANRLREIEIEFKKNEIALSKRVKMETLAIIAANLAGIAIIIGYERIHVVSSKAIGFVMRAR